MMIFFLSLGSNISPRHHYIDAACGLIEQRVGHIFRRSSDFYSAPWGYTSDHQYLNIALLLSSSLSPEQLLAATQLIERELGRTVKNHYQDRTIDIDLIACFSDNSTEGAGASAAYKEIILRTHDLVLPHPLAHERPFVMVPLREISAGFPLSITLDIR